MKHIIVNHFVNDKNKDEKPFLTKDGKPFKKVTIKVAEDSKRPQEYDGKYISCLVFKDDDACLQWQSGDYVDILIEKNGEFFNFRQPSRIDILESRVKISEKKIEVLEAFMGNGSVKEEVDDELPELEENSEDIPF